MRGRLITSACSTCTGSTVRTMPQPPRCSSMPSQGPADLPRARRPVVRALSDGVHAAHDDIAGESDLARRFAQRGLELDPLDPFVNFTMGRTFWLSGDLEGGPGVARARLPRSAELCARHLCQAWTETLAAVACRAARTSTSRCD